MSQDFWTVLFFHEINIFRHVQVEILKSVIFLVRVNFRKLPSLCCFSAKHCEKNPECGTKSHMKLTCRDKVAEYSEIQYYMYDFSTESVYSEAVFVCKINDVLYVMI